MRFFWSTYIQTKFQPHRTFRHPDISRHSGLIAVGSLGTSKVSWPHHPMSPYVGIKSLVLFPTSSQDMSCHMEDLAIFWISMNIYYLFMLASSICVFGKVGKGYNAVLGGDKVFWLIDFDFLIFGIFTSFFNRFYWPGLWLVWSTVVMRFLTLFWSLSLGSVNRYSPAPVVLCLPLRMVALEIGGVSSVQFIELVF